MGRISTVLAATASVLCLTATAGYPESHEAAGPDVSEEVQGRLVTPDGTPDADDPAAAPATEDADPPAAPDEGAGPADAPPDPAPVPDPAPEAPPPPAADSGIDVDLLMDTLLSALEDMQELHPRIDALEGQVAAHEKLLRQVCTNEGYEADPPDCLHLHPDPPDLDPLQAQIDELNRTILTLQGELAELRARPAAPTAEPPVIAEDPDPAPTPREDTGPVVAEGDPFVLRQTPDGLPLFPAQREFGLDQGPLAAMIPDLPDAAMCQEAGQWLVDSAANRIADAFYVTREGEIAMCKLVGDQWSVVSAGRLDKAHIVIEGGKQ
ncbi:hypothetical protein WAF00_06925 [Mameliella alba]|uniref:hypothetical protein n=2 Tax=Mameliella alba TaxID=561184 RepID=UPI003013188A